jgi:DNA-directed RNA polymerase I, II, and III subunit RPABC3
MELILDIHSEIYPMKLQEKFSLSLTHTLSLDGTPDENIYDQSGAPSLLDRCDYAMQGKLFNYISDEKDKQGKV